MDSNEFFDRYINEDITTISDVVIDFFKQEFDEDMLKEYDFGEVITEFTGHHEEAKKFEEIEAFREAIKNNQAALYRKEGEYLNDALIKYYCFRNEEQKLKEITADIGSMNYGYINLLAGFKQLLYHQYTDLANDIIEEKYTEVRNAPKDIEDADLNLAIVKYYIELEQLFLAQKNTSDYDLSDFKQKISAYHFEFDELYYKHVEMALLDDSLEGIQELLKEFPSDKLSIIATLETRFFKMMQAKNCPVPVAGMIWYNALKYLDAKKTRNWRNYFMLESNSFKQYLNDLSGFFVDDTREVVLSIWGSGYILDFVYQAQIIPESQYKDQKNLLRELKAEFKKRYKYDLWEYSFVHKWLPDEMTNLEQWEAEKKEFEMSYDLDYKESKEARLAHLISKPFSVPKVPVAQPKQITKAKQIGRNEKVTVKYHDGRVVKDIKYKKVKKDIENGECEIV